MTTEKTLNEIAIIQNKLNDLRAESNRNTIQMQHLYGTIGDLKKKNIRIDNEMQSLQRKYFELCSKK